MSVLDNGIPPATGKVGVLMTPCDRHPQAAQYCEPGPTGNKVEINGLVRTDYLNQQFARQEAALRSAISSTVMEQLAPLIEKMQVLLDSTPNARALSQAGRRKTEEDPIQLCESEDSLVLEAKETSHGNEAASSGQIPFQPQYFQLQRQSSKLSL